MATLVITPAVTLKGMFRPAGLVIVPDVLTLPVMLNSMKLLLQEEVLVQWLAGKAAQKSVPRLLRDTCAKAVVAKDKQAIPNARVRSKFDLIMLTKLKFQLLTEYCPQTKTLNSYYLRSFTPEKYILILTIHNQFMLFYNCGFRFVHCDKTPLGPWAMAYLTELGQCITPGTMAKQRAKNDFRWRLAWSDNAIFPY
jgi:hypothetical protein